MLSKVGETSLKSRKISMSAIVNGNFSEVKMTDRDLVITVRQIPCIDLTNDDETTDSIEIIEQDSESKMVSPIQTNRNIQLVQTNQMQGDQSESAWVNKLNCKVDEETLLKIIRLKWNRPQQPNKKVYNLRRNWVKKKEKFRPITLDNPYFQNLKKKSAGSSNPRDNTTPNFIDIVKNTFWNLLLRDNKK